MLCLLRVIIRMGGGGKRNVVPLFGLGLGAVSHCTNVSFPLVLDSVSNASAYEEVIMEKCGCLVSYDYDGPGCGDENNANHMQYHLVTSKGHVPCERSLYDT